MRVKGFFRDISGASRVTDARLDKIDAASAVPDPKDPIRELADRLHPGKQEFTVTKIYDASPTSKTFRLEPVNGHIAPFRAGQYANFYLKIGGSVLTRPYSISSAPFEARGEKPFFEITIRKNVPYFVPDYIFENVKEGSTLSAALPFGEFCYEPLRDAKRILGLAGGSGVTPFVSMAKEIAEGRLDCELLLLYGSVKPDDIVCKDQLDEAEKKSEGRVKVVHVISGDDEWEGEKGFITAELVAKYAEGDMSLFFCGPLAMHRAVDDIVKAFDLTPRRFRAETPSQPSDVKQIPGFPEEQIGKVYKLTVLRGIQEDVIDARADEPVAVALERAAIAVDTHCRGGACGFCRSQLLEGELFYSPLGDGRRKQDRESGFFHACSAYPVSDVRIRIPIL